VVVFIDFKKICRRRTHLFLLQKVWIIPREILVQIYVLLQRETIAENIPHGPPIPGSCKTTFDDGRYVRESIYSGLSRYNWRMYFTGALP
jgi:hypothetical protein